MPTWIRPLTAYARRRLRARNVICLPELFRAQYFCQREDIALFDLAEPIPGPGTERWPQWRARNAWW